MGRLTAGLHRMSSTLSWLHAHLPKTHQLYSCSGPQTGSTWAHKQGFSEPTFPANTEDRGPTLGANGPTVFAPSLQTGL
jgi:hypothetical protein